MKGLRDFEKRHVRFTAERREHILEHPEMKGMISQVGKVLAEPQRVVLSLSDDESYLYYRWYVDTCVGDKYLCVVVKVRDKDAFVLTAYLTDSIKKGELLWPKRV